MDVKIKLWSGAEMPNYLPSGYFDLKVNTFKAIYKGHKKMIPSESMQSSLNQGYIQLRPFERVLIGTGIHFDIPEGYRLEIISRPGTTWGNGLTLLNSPAYIDATYKDEVTLVLYNTCQFLNKIEFGSSIARACFVPAPLVIPLTMGE